MGVCYSRLEGKEAVSRCKSRKRYVKEFVKSGHFLCASHSIYLRSLRSLGSSLFQFSSAESSLHVPLPRQTPPQAHPHPHPQPTLPSPPPPPLSPITYSWTTTSSSDSQSQSQAPLPPPPPPPPLPRVTGWDFWDPFAGRPQSEEEWGVAPVASAAAEPVSKAMVVSRGRNGSGKNLEGIAKELEEYFSRAADSGVEVSGVLGVPVPGFGYQDGGAVVGKPLQWQWQWQWDCASSPKCSNGKSKEGGGGGHSSTAERLYAWEKKLYQEVKNAEALKIEQEKKMEQLRKLDLKRADYMKIEKTKKEVERLESQMTVASQAIETTSTEIIKLRDEELYPQLVELLKRLMCMWRSTYECHQVQNHIVQQLKFLNMIPSAEPTSEIHRQSTLQLELQVQQWHLSFCSLVKAQRDYVQSLAGWLRLSLFQFNNKSSLAGAGQESRIYSLCEEWQRAVDRIPDKVASEGIKSLTAAIHTIVVQQGEEHKQKKRSESADKKLEKRTNELRSLESRHGPFSVHESSASGRGKDPVGEKRSKVVATRTKAEEEKAKHEKAVNITRSMTMNNLQMGLPHVFQAMAGFSSVCMQAYESLYDHLPESEEPGKGNANDLKRLLN